MIDTRYPLQVRTAAMDQLQVAWLGNGHCRLAVIDEVAQLVLARPGIGGDDDGAQLGTRMPALQELRAVIHVKQHKIALNNAPGAQACGEGQYPAVEFRIGDDRGWQVERRPDDKRVIRTRLGLGLEQPGNISSIGAVKQRDRFCRWRCQFATLCLPSI